MCGRKGKRENERWQKRGKEEEGEERREREREKENGENGARGALPSPDAFPSAKLGNNMTPIKGRLWKNTTPTSRSPAEPNQNLHKNFQRRRPDFDASSRTNFSYAPEGSKYKFYRKEATIYKKAKTLGNPRKCLKFSINQHYRRSHLSKKNRSRKIAYNNFTLTSSSTLDRSRYLRSQISSCYIVTRLYRHSATAPRAQQLTLTSSSTLDRSCYLRS